MTGKLRYVRLAAAAAELLRPDVDAAGGLELADPQPDADVGEAAEDVAPVPGRSHPEPEDPLRRRHPAARVGDVLAPAAAAVAAALDPIGELAPAGFVAEFVAAEDVAGLAVGGAGERGRRAQRLEPTARAGAVDEAEDSPLLNGGGRSPILLTRATRARGGGTRRRHQCQEKARCDHEPAARCAPARHRPVIPGAYSLITEKKGAGWQRRFRKARESGARSSPRSSSSSPVRGPP